MIGSIKNLFKFPFLEYWSASNWASLLSLCILHIFYLLSMTEWSSKDEKALSIVLCIAVPLHTIYFFAGCVILEAIELRRKLTQGAKLEYLCRISVLLYVNLQYFIFQTNNNSMLKTNSERYWIMIILVPAFYFCWHIILRFYASCERGKEPCSQLSKAFLPADIFVLLGSVFLSYVFKIGLEAGALNGIIAVIGLGLIVLACVKTLSEDPSNLERIFTDYVVL